MAKKRIGAKIIAITNQKGGVGKTTTSVNLADCLSRFKKRILLVDLDPQASASCSLGINRRVIDYSVHDVFVSKKPIDSMIVKPTYSLCHILPANLELAQIEAELVENPERSFILANRLNEIRENYDYIILDCPPSLGIITINALYAADSVIIPVQCQFLAMDGLTQLLNTIKTIQKKKRDNNKTLEIEGVLLTMHEKKVTSCWQITEEIKECFREKVFDTIISKNVKASEAPAYQKPVSMYAPSCPAAKQYRSLAKELISRNE